MNNLDKIESSKFDQKKMYAVFNGDGARPIDTPNAEESKRFLGDLWSIGKRHNLEAEWLEDIKNELVNDKHHQERVVISVQKVTKQCRKIPNWKTPEKDAFKVIELRTLAILMKGLLFKETRS